MTSQAAELLPAETPQPEKPKRKTRGRSLTPRVDINKAVALRIQSKLSYEDIAKTMGVSRVAVFKQLKPLMKLMENPEATAAYRDNRAEFMDSIERTLTTQMLSKDKLKSASVNNLAYAVSQLNNIGRLERGLSTQNIATVIGLNPDDREWLAGVCGQMTQRLLDDGNSEGIK